MKIISIDVGTKNPSYCIMESHPDSTITIHAWACMPFFDTIPIEDDDGNEENESFTCQQIVTRKNKVEVCGKKAYFYGMNKTNNNKFEKHYCCNAHANAHPTKPVVASVKTGMKPSKLQKMNMEALGALLLISPGSSFTIHTLPKTKKACIDELLLSEQLHKLRPITFKKKIKQLNGNTAPFMMMSEKMTEIFDNEPAMDNIEFAFIENQTTSRMRSVQRLIMQYFMCRLKTSAKVKFIHSMHKLKGFVRPAHLINIPVKNKSKRFSSSASTDNHTKNKICAELYCTQLLKQLVPRGGDWVQFFNTKTTANEKDKENKYDDLADSFLQGLYCLDKYK